MGAIGGLLGLGGGNSGTGYGTNFGTSAGQLGTAYGGVQNAMTGQNNLLSALQGQNGLGNQSQVYNQFQNIAAGNGPNPAQAMLNQATGQNVANQAALMAGQRGASANPALIARQAAQQGANIQQQAAGQGASMQAQQALGALGQAAGQANTMAGQQIGQTNQNTANQQNEQNILQSANTASNQVQGQLANTGMQGQQGLMGGLMNGAGALLGIAHGGVIPKMADGGSIGPQSLFGQALMPVNSSPGAGFGGGTNSGADAMANSMKAKPKQPAPSVFGQDDISADNTFSGIGMLAANGGKVKAMVSPGEKVLQPTEAKMVAGGKISPAKVGEKIPGKAPVKGDSYKNDTVRKDLPEGGVVIPRSVMNSKNPEKGAAEFVRAVMAKKRAK